MAVGSTSQIAFCASKLPCQATLKPVTALPSTVRVKAEAGGGWTTAGPRRTLDRYSVRLFPQHRRWSAWAGWCPGCSGPPRCRRRPAAAPPAMRRTPTPPRDGPGRRVLRGAPLRRSPPLGTHPARAHCGAGRPRGHAGATGNSRAGSARAAEAWRAPGDMTTLGAGRCSCHVHRARLLARVLLRHPSRCPSPHPGLDCPHGRPPRRLGGQPRRCSRSASPRQRRGARPPGGLDGTASAKTHFLSSMRP